MRNEVTMVSEASQCNAITHGGKFHADEVFATAVLSMFMPVRLMRVFAVPEGTDAIVYDIGAGKYDHHMKGGNGERENGIPYASAGLIWQDYGRRALSALGCADDLLDEAWSNLDERLVQPIDAVDNGLSAFDGEKRYSTVSISDIVASFNPNWDVSLEKESYDRAFLQAVGCVQEIAERFMRAEIARAKAGRLVEQAIADAPERRILVLEQFMPWKHHLFASKQEKAGDIWYVIFPSARGGYNVQCVPDAEDSFGERHALPVSWRGLRGEELAKVCGIESAIFCHPSGFIGGAGTLEDALAFARLAAETDE